MSACVRAIGTATPRSRRSQDELADAATRLCRYTPEQDRLMRRFYEGSTIRERGLVVFEGAGNGEATLYRPGTDAADRGPTTGERLRRYPVPAKDLAVEAAHIAIERAGTARESISHVVTSTCTGFSAPGVDVHLIDAIGLRPDVDRTCVGFMGCHGALNALRVARALVVRGGWLGDHRRGDRQLVRGDLDRLRAIRHRLRVPARRRFVIEFRDVHKAFGAKRVLRGVSLEVARGEVMFIIGTSGVGKSVTIKHLVGLLRVDRGELWYYGTRIDQLSETAFYPIRKRIGMVFQSYALFASMTLKENVALPLRKHKGMRIRVAEREAVTRLEQVHMAAFADRYPAELSDGMRKRAAIARTLTLDPEVVLFDEPTTGLDPVMTAVIDEVILDLGRELHTTSVTITHDLKSAFRIADRIAMLYEGRVLAFGTPDEIRQSEHEAVQQFVSGRAHGPIAP